MKKKSPEPNELKITRKVRYLPQIAVPWGRGSSEFRPGIFAKRYLVKHGEASASQVFSALKEALSQMNQERIEIGDKPIRGCTYNSFAKYWHWFKILGLIAFSGANWATVPESKWARVPEPKWATT